MAGEWLKMECSTPDKPEVFAITAAMGWDDPDLTVGKLFRLWRWFDQQTTDGNARGVTPALLDRIAGVSGFAHAMASVGWLVITDAGVCLPKFENHNGATAKARAQTAKRVANHRGNAQTVTPTVTPPLAREEKKREEKKNTGAKAPSSAYAPPDWLPAGQWAEFVKMRKAMRNIPFTDAAAKGVVADLEKLVNQGLSAEELLQAAVTNGWRTVYRPKAQHGEVNKQQALEDRNLAVARQWVEENHATQ